MAVLLFVLLMSAQAADDGGVPSYIRAESAQERQTRLGTAEDPGLDPDPKKRYWRFGKSVRILKFERRFATYDQPPGFVRPFGQANVAAEIYQQNEKYVWIWAPDPDPADQIVPSPPPAPRDPYNDATYAFLNRVRPQFTPLTPPASAKTIRFVESSAGLPASGSWRNSADIADMNGDGCMDIAAPPERQGNGMPSVFLGDCKGSWQSWPAMTFPRRIDYGSVVARDFNKDGRMDLAFAIHLNGISVFLGDGKGNFRESAEGLPRNFPTRKVLAVDLDRDGDLDLVALSEGPTTVEGVGGWPLRAFLNSKRGSQWTEVAIAGEDVKLGGDWLTIANLDGDRYPDAVASSVYYGSMDLVHLGAAKGKWTAVASDGDLVPSLSYYFANGAGKFTSKTREDALISYVRFWPRDASPQRVAPPKLSQVVNLDRLSFADGKATRQSIARWEGGSVRGLATADFDRDGNLDFAYVLDEPRSLVIMMGDGKGSFATASVGGVTLATNPIYDLKVADLNKDGVADLLLMYETGSKSVFDRTGSMHVFLGVESSRNP